VTYFGRTRQPAQKIPDQFDLYLEIRMIFLSPEYEKPAVDTAGYWKRSLANREMCSDRDL
jgi:hypothetical protein